MIFNNQKYELIEDYKNGYKDDIEEKITDYYDNYDYILGDWSYGKLRLKGFCNKENKIYKIYNDIEKKNDYLKNECAYDCSYFLLKKI